MMKYKEINTRYHTSVIDKSSIDGITLIALVVTIVVLIILATISINAVLGENGIIKKAEQAKELYNNSMVSEEEDMNKLLEEYNNALVTDTIPDVPYEDNTLPTVPKVAEGMTKVKYNSSTGKWEKVEEVYINNSSTYITGNAGNTAGASSASGVTNAYNTTGGMKASTTGNTTGIYDMSGGNWERVAAYITNGHGNLTTYGADLVNGENKYKNVYTSTVSDGSNAQEADYALATPAKGHYGGAVYETSSSYTSSNSWYSDDSTFPYSSYPFFVRDGGYGNESGTGVFSFGDTGGGTSSDNGFRVIVPVLYRDLKYPV